MERSRVGERAREFDSDAAVRVGRGAGGVGQLAKPVSVGAHRKDLIVKLRKGKPGRWSGSWPVLKTIAFVTGSSATRASASGRSRVANEPSERGPARGRRAQAIAERIPYYRRPSRGYSRTGLLYSRCTETRCQSRFPGVTYRGSLPPESARPADTSATECNASC